MQNYTSAKRLSIVSNTVTRRLFDTPWKSNEEELLSGYKYVNGLLSSNSMTTNSVTLYAQRVIAQLCVLDKSKRNRVGNVFELEGFWPQARELFEARLDPVCNELMLTKIDSLSEGEIHRDVSGVLQDILALCNKTKSIDGLFSRYVNSIESKLSIGESQILKNVIDKRTENLQRDFHAYRSFSELLHPKSNITWVNAFFSTYISAGVVSSVQVFAGEKLRLKISASLPSCIITPKINDDNIYVVLQLKRAVVVYSADGRFGYLLNAARLPQSGKSIVDGLDKLKSNLGFGMSKAGMWQYRVSYVLKKQTGFVPKRSDYMVKK
ncbi:hypothetical protein [Vibrio maritimus]|uniref:hypothetical protein n=1 Tax=Vibrio maritimus TaxID=990268 RepID=UPI003735C2A4